MSPLKSAIVVGFSGCFLLGGCGKPNAANIELRRLLQERDETIRQLETQQRADRATIAQLQAAGGAPAIATLPREQLDLLFTTHGLSMSRLTGLARIDPKSPDPDGVKVYVVPTDQSGQPIKSAGRFVVEVFDLANVAENLVVRREFSVEESRKAWVGEAFQYTYVLNVPFGKLIAAKELTVRVTFTDELTQRQFTAQRVVQP
jgi:hypothetical protein